MKKIISSLFVSFFLAFLSLSSSVFSGEMTPEEYALWKENQMGNPDLSGYVTDPRNDYISIAVDSYGRFTMGKANGSKLLYGHPNPWSSYSTIRIDGINYTNKGMNFGLVITTPSDISADTNVGEWQIGFDPYTPSRNVRVKQTLAIVTGSSTGNPDTGKIQYTITNNDSVAHSVGVRIMMAHLSAYRIPGQ